MGYRFLSGRSQVIVQTIPINRPITLDPAAYRGSVVIDLLGLSYFSDGIKWVGMANYPFPPPIANEDFFNTGALNFGANTGVQTFNVAPLIDREAGVTYNYRHMSELFGDTPAITIHPTTGVISINTNIPDPNPLGFWPIEITDPFYRYTNVSFTITVT